MQKILPEAVDVRGSEKFTEKERKLSDFAEGKIRILITKPEIAGFGLNFQHCRSTIFVGVTYSFEKTYQALRRFWRYGQTHDVTAYMIVAESEGEIMKTLQVKQTAHREMQKAMNEAMKESGLVATDHRGMKLEQ